MRNTALLDALLDPEEDAHLLRLTLHTPHLTYPAQQTILRPPPLPPPPPNSITLHTPPLPLPWAATLATSLRIHLNLHLLPTPPPPPHLQSPLLAALLSRTAPLPAIYAPLPAPLVARNAATLAKLRCSYPPFALARIATTAKLGHLAVVRAWLAPPLPERCVSASPVCGEWLPGREMFLLQKKLIPQKMVADVGRMLLERYNIQIVTTGPGMPERGSLASLSNAGSALLVRDGGGGGGRVRNLERYFWRRCNKGWGTVCEELVNEAGMEKDGGTGEVEAVVGRLVRRAVGLETAGASLGKMCAYAIAVAGPCGTEVERRVGMLSGEYCGLVERARARVARLERGGAEWDVGGG